MNKFIAIDVETADDDRASIVQIGLAVYVDEFLVNVESHLTLPEYYADQLKDMQEYPEDFEESDWDFDNTYIHSITLTDVVDAPSLADTLRQILPRLEGEVLVQHNGFDKSAIEKACDEYGIVMPDVTWLDSATVVRRVWPERAKKGYGLADVSEMLGYEFDHHKAHEDAKAAGNIITTVIREKGHTLDGLIELVKPLLAVPIKHDSSEGDLSDEVFVFTGTLSLDRRKIAAMVAARGAAVKPNMSKKVTTVVAGIGGEGTGKAKKADAYGIKIIDEAQFVALIA